MNPEYVPSKEEVSKQLFGYIEPGKCFHNIIETHITDGDHIPIRYDGFLCDICGEIWESRFYNPDYFTWEGFGIVWKFAIKQDWWNEFKIWYWNFHKNKGVAPVGDSINEYIINPKTFARDVLGFLNELKGRERWKRKVKKKHRVQ